MGDWTPNIPEMVLLVCDYELIGRQSQTWVRCPDRGRKVVGRHVSTTHGKAL
jgi:hypothetical protein